jgi:hypothetical protein
MDLDAFDVFETGKTDGSETNHSSAFKSNLITSSQSFQLPNRNEGEESKPRLGKRGHDSIVDDVTNNNDEDEGDQAKVIQSIRFTDFILFRHFPIFF